MNIINRRVRKELACEKCGGRGTVVNHTSSHFPCWHCGGSGHITMREVGTIYEYDVTCPSCGGTGETGNASWVLSQCPECRGTGMRSGKNVKSDDESA